MKRCLSVLAAAAMAGAVAGTSFAPAQAATPRIVSAISADAGGEIRQVHDSRNKWRKRSRQDRRNYRHRRHRTAPHFSFSVPFVVPYGFRGYPSQCRGQVFRGRDGHLYCRVY